MSVKMQLHSYLPLLQEGLGYQYGNTLNDPPNTAVPAIRLYRPISPYLHNSQPSLQLRANPQIHTETRVHSYLQATTLKSPNRGLVHQSLNPTHLRASLVHQNLQLSVAEDAPRAQKTKKENATLQIAKSKWSSLAVLASRCHLPLPLSAKQNLVLAKTFLQHFLSANQLGLGWRQKRADNFESCARPSLLQKKRTESSRRGRRP
ncbi:hypothetical protein DFH27DRAFT_654147 [Peziza echinospora]|nr:hypothetical protein DFH27DRAFT_654147 [Peziza echinospora]